MITSCSTQCARAQLSPRSHPLHTTARHCIIQVRAARILATGDLAVVKVLKTGGMLEDGSFRLNAMLHLHEIWWVIAAGD